jgi:hypothetical protein
MPDMTLANLANLANLNEGVCTRGKKKIKQENPSLKSNNHSESGTFKTGKNVVCYPIFLQCCEHTKDEFWKNIFESMSYGNCPSCIYISKDTIYSSNKKKPFSFIIPKDKQSIEVFKEVKELLMKNTSLCSVADTREKREKLMKKVNKDDITDTTSWTEIRKKNTKEILIIKFVIRMKSKYGLTWDTTRHLYRLIQVGFLCKTQTSRDVHLEKKRIESIDGIKYDSNKKRFYNEYINNEIQPEKEDDDSDTKYLYYYWNKYVIQVSKMT